MIRALSKISRAYARDTEGATAVEVGLLLGAMIVLTGGGLEMGLAYHQQSAAQQAAQIGARLAATHPPVARDLNNMTGLGGNVRTGDPMPDYLIECSGANRSCSQGGYDNNAMTILLKGSDRTGCNDDNRDAQGMCDMFNRLEDANVDVRYEGSGLGRAGSPGDPLPLITVTVRDLEYDFVFIDRLLPGTRQMKPVSATVMAENIRGGA